MPLKVKDPNSELLALRIPMNLMKKLNTIGGRVGGTAKYVRAVLKTSVNPCSQTPYFKRVTENTRGYFNHILDPEKDYSTAEVALSEYILMLEKAVKK